MNRKGVTLIELIVVMVIIAIGAVLIAPNIGAFLPAYRLRSATRDVTNILRTAQMKAISHNVAFGVAFDLNAKSYQLYRNTGGKWVADIAPVSLPDTVGFVNNTFPNNADADVNNKPFARFDPNSSASTGSIGIKGKKGENRIVASATGRIRID